MSRFSLRYPYFVIVACLMVCVVGITTLVRMPVDLFPSIKIPVVVVATFFSGMPPEQIENDITGRFERFFTLGSGIDHIESRSLPGVSLIKIYFQPGTNADSAVTTISNLAMANLRRLPPGTLPPVVLKFDASSLPVCLITLKGEGMNETQLRDLGQYAVRNQVANVPGASVPQPFGGRYRQIMVYVDPLKLEAHQLSVMDVVRSVNESNLILPAGDVKIGPFDYNLYTNSQLNTVEQINSMPLKTVNGSSVLVGDVGKAADAAQIQTSIVRVDGQRSVYLPVLKQGGDANTISVVNGIKSAVAGLVDVPKSLVAKVVFDQSIFVKSAIENLLHEGAIGLILTGLMILVFLGNFRATIAVFLSIPLSALAAFIGLSFGNNSVNAMILGGLALAFSRLIDNSVVVLENIFRHVENGEDPVVAAEKGGREVALPVLAATLTTAVVFFPVIFLYGVSRFLFTALALSVVLSLFASYVVAMTVVPLFCAKFIRQHGTQGTTVEAPTAASQTRALSFMERFNRWFNERFHSFLNKFDVVQARTLARPFATVLAIVGIFALSMCLYPALGFAYFPRTDPGQFVINLKAATGTRLEQTEQEVKKVEDIVRRTVSAHDLRLIASNIGVTPGFSSIYTSNSASHTAFVQVSLTDDHKVGSYEYMDRVRAVLRTEAPELTSYFQSGGLVDAVLNLGLPAPLDIQVSGSNLEQAYATAAEISSKVRALPGVQDVLIPQDIDAPAYKLAIDRERTSELGLNEKEVVSNVITALASDQVIAPSYWVDPRTGNDYFLTVQYPENAVKSLNDLRAIPLRGAGQKEPTRLDAVTQLIPVQAPTEVDHYQLQRVIDVYVAPRTEELGRVAAGVDHIIDQTTKPEGVRVQVRGSVQAMRSSFVSFGLGLLLSVVLVYLILVAQFKSFVDPLLILLAVPPGLSGVLVILICTGTTLNIMSLMGVVMMAGIVVSNSILLVEFTHRLLEDGMPLLQALQTASRVRLRPILMTSLATIIGLVPMALKLGTGSEAYAPLARAIIGGLLSSLVLTMFIVPAAFHLVYRRRAKRAEGVAPHPSSPRGLQAVSTGLAVFVLVFFLSSGRVQCQPVPVDHLDLQKAESLALRQAPAIAREYFRALAANEVVKQTRSGLFPQLTGSIAAVGTGDEISSVFGGSPITNTNPESPVTTRLGATGGLNDPSVFSRESNGVNLTQLVTDFGRTANLIAASRFAALSQQQQVEVARSQVLLLVDEAYFRALEAEALSRVAEETVSTRQVIVDQITALAQAQLRSDLDASFAEVNLQQANLLLLDAQTREQVAFADLSAALGYQEPHKFVLEDATVPELRDQTLTGLLTQALQSRPDVVALREDVSAASKTATAEQRARLPKVNLLGSFGRTPTGDVAVRETYAAAGFDVELPLWTGGRLSARAREMELRIGVARKSLQDLEDQVTRDVNVGWLQAAQARSKIPVTESLLNAASQAFDLAKSRYERGAASFVELSQAELAKTQAAIDETTARYEYEISKAVLEFDTGSLQFVKPSAPPR